MTSLYLSLSLYIYIYIFIYVICTYTSHVYVTTINVDYTGRGASREHDTCGQCCVIRAPGRACRFRYYSTSHYIIHMHICI